MADIDPDLLEREGELAELIQAILDKYALLLGNPETGIDGEVLCLNIGNLVQDERSSPPQVCWVETGGTGEQGRGAGGSPNNTDSPEAYADWVSIDVEIWRETAKECRDCKTNLLAAMRQALEPYTYKYVDYQRVTDRHEAKGVIFRMRIQLRMSIPLNGTGEHPRQVEIERHYGELVDAETTDDTVVDVQYPHFLEDP